jgi:hypothetical protein
MHKFLLILALVPAIAFAGPGQRDDSKNRALGWDKRPVTSFKCPGTENDVVTIVHEHNKPVDTALLMRACADVIDAQAHANVVQVDAATRQQSMANSFATGIPMYSKGNTMATGGAAIGASQYPYYGFGGGIGVYGAGMQLGAMNMALNSQGMMVQPPNSGGNQPPAATVTNDSAKKELAAARAELQETKEALKKQAQLTKEQAEAAAKAKNEAEAAKAAKK